MLQRNIVVEKLIDCFILWHMEILLTVFIYSFREKLMTVPRKKTQIDVKKASKAEVAARIDNVIFLIFFIVRC